MMVLAGWCAAMACLFWLRRESLAWIPLIGVAPGIFISGERGPWFLAALLSLLIFYMNRPSAQAASEIEKQRAFLRFWQETAVLLTAGLTFWQAVESAAQTESLLTPIISLAAQHITQQSRALAEPNVLGSDGQLHWLLLQHGYLHGVSPAQIQAHVRHLQTRLAYQDEATKRHGPLWMTVLPAILLLNVLWIFLAPMAALAGHGWIKISHGPL